MRLSLSERKNSERSFERGATRTGGKKKLLSAGTLRGGFSLDTGVIIEMLFGTALGEAVVDALASDKTIAYASYVNVSEAEYIICRKLGRELARAWKMLGRKRINDNEKMYGLWNVKEVFYHEIISSPVSASGSMSSSLSSIFL